MTAPPHKFNYLSQPECVIDLPIESHFPIMAKLSQDASDDTNIPTELQTTTTSIISTEDLAESIVTSTDTLFFISYLMSNTL